MAGTTEQRETMARIVTDSLGWMFETLTELISTGRDHERRIQELERRGERARARIHSDPVDLEAQRSAE